MTCSWPSRCTPRGRNPETAYKGARATSVCGYVGGEGQRMNIVRGTPCPGCRRVHLSCVLRGVMVAMKRNSSVLVGAAGSGGGGLLWRGSWRVASKTINHDVHKACELPGIVHDTEGSIEHLPMYHTYEHPKSDSPRRRAAAPLLLSPFPTAGAGAPKHRAMPHPRGDGQGQVRAGAAVDRVADQAHDRRGGGCVHGRRGADAEHQRQGVVAAADTGGCGCG